jgi:hypothetical protein
MNKQFSLLVLAALFTGYAGFSQESDPASKSKESAPNNWHVLDAAESGVEGISLDKAYSYLKAKNLKSKKVLVAVIDSGIDTLHEDLKPVLWVNKGEIPGNGQDDDHNGYVDDIHGWNFLGGKDGRSVKEDSYEAARVYHQLKNDWVNFSGDPKSLSKKQRASYLTYKKAEKALLEDSDTEEMGYIKQIYPKIHAGDSLIRKDLGKEEYGTADLENYKPTDADAKMMKGFLSGIAKANSGTDITNKQIMEEIEGQLRKATTALDAPEEYRKNIVGDDESNFEDRSYGNNDVMASTPFHGTHCSGIIGAVRDNGIGMQGIADNVEIMMVRAVPDGDEHDKDIALAIRYAVDNGARVISMSFGKSFSPQKKWVDDAFRYAAKKGVLLVHAAGNDSKNIDTTDNFPSVVFLKSKKKAKNVITVGASGNQKNGGLTAAFSNYGKDQVDVFAPGVAIYSTIPGGNTYGKASGTSMACPVVAGIASLLMEYYPGLSYSQVKKAIEQSVVKPGDKVRNPETRKKVDMSELCRTGGIVNAYEAVKAAEAMAGSSKN